MDVGSVNKVRTFQSDYWLSELSFWPWSTKSNQPRTSSYARINVISLRSIHAILTRRRSMNNHLSFLVLYLRAYAERAHNIQMPQTSYQEGIPRRICPLRSKLHQFQYFLAASHPRKKLSERIGSYDRHFKSKNPIHETVNQIPSSTTCIYLHRYPCMHAHYTWHICMYSIWRCS